MKINRLSNQFLNQKLIKICIYVSLLTFLPGLLIGFLIAFFFGPESYSVLFLFPPNLATRPFLEWMMLLAAILWLIPQSFLILKNFKST